ncbi:Undecaprenyl-phosphate galactose phosphotransferase, WbaP/exopolysaccharide biosynthesis polyprenyl glycosylphosphotransferase [Paramicrobacterium humi]|uniref:Undecaprenyl-phosphate galactose phosphotransferase, WbaP/exopolysaccharide biosynthesis polyprenyl glycosylphosphotransferase n=1 Tax=Paramicrobacterium humi TaxID=640635 RepID=A0A1H4MJT4_9MICO|nr:sugar transferase [Microbacterium humi]SEB83341.1 Undecaprenyl-phosphate galactose phosphotransferase, WbaP/exopolysaccharide biosynthesis polyprenyl glycosylphosphotransferase [Microbacterium humi]
MSRIEYRFATPASVFRPAFDVRSRLPRIVAPAVSWRRRLQIRLLVTDALVVALSMAVSATVATDVSAVTEVFVDPRGLIAAIVGVGWLATLAVFRTRSTPLLGVGTREYKRILNASVLYFGMVAIVFILVPVADPRALFAVALPAGTVSLLASRWSWRRWLNHQRRYGNYLSRAIVVGDRADVSYVAQELERTSSAAYSVVGAAVFDGDEQPVSGLIATVPIVAHPDKVAEAVGRLDADSVIVASTNKDDVDYIRDLSWKLETRGISLVVAPRLTNVAGSRIQFRAVDALPLLQVDLASYDGWRYVMKRSFDILMSAAALLVLAPIMLIIAIFVRLDSEGPALFRQERVGKDGQTFTMLKFRSMVHNADDDIDRLLEQNDCSGVLFKMRSDPRVTRVGHFLRAHSLDELPQFLNVLRGDMSVVGPRPSLQREVQNYERHVRRRMNIRPGITGLWQVNGRSDLDWEESVRLDLYYVENWTLCTDLSLIWRTVRVLFRPVGAY